MKIIFAGTPQFALPTLQALIHARHEMVAIYTQPDKPAGRGRKTVASCIKTFAQQQFPIMQPTTLRDPLAIEQLESYQADLMVVVAYGLLLPERVLSAPRYGCINVHASSLPRWRGAAPIHHAILAGDTQTGITIMQMDLGLDTGNMLKQVSCPIEAQDTTGSLHDKLSLLGAKTCVEVIHDLPSYLANATPQDPALATYAHKITKKDAAIDWRQPAMLIERQIRGFNPTPIAFTLLDGQALRIFHAEIVPQTYSAKPGTIVSHTTNALIVACGDNALALTQLQLPGSKVLSTKELLNARAQLFAVGKQFGDVP